MRRLILLLVAVLALAGCGGDDEETARPTQAGIQALDNVLALRSAFEADAGNRRLLVLLSPT